MVPLSREPCVVSRVSGKTDEMQSSPIAIDHSNFNYQSNPPCGTNQQWVDDCTRSDGKGDYSSYEGMITEPEHNASKIKTRELPIETTSLLFSGRFKDTDEESNSKPNTHDLEASNDGWKLLTWWFCRIMLPLALIAWYCTKSTLIVFLSMIFIPALAIVQGSLAILRYRRFHGDCPVPKAPSHGIVQVLDRTAMQSDRKEKNQLSVDGREGPDTTAPPIRLLVVGDSLAVGVGQSSSSTPILPETVAMSLSKALDGRSVLWTCHGAPGASTGWIVRELEECLHHSSCQHSEAMSGPQHETDIAGSHKWNVPDTQKINTARDSSTPGVVEEIIVSASESAADETLDQYTEEDQGKQIQEDSLHLDRFDSSIMGGPFDVVVVLTGSNDLKSTFFPFLLSGEDAKFREEARQRGGGYGKELTRLLKVLNQRMRWRLQTLQDSIEGVTQQVMNHFASIDRGVLRHDGSMTSSDNWDNKAFRETCSTSNNDGVCQSQFPLVVLPGMAARTLPIFSGAPLRWLAVPIVDIMDNHKRRLAENHQGEVLFVEAPTTEQIIEYTEGNGAYSTQDQDDYVVLRHRSITTRETRRIESHMQAYYSQPLRPTSPTASNRHFDIFSMDGIHPNDIGYKFWVRHIAHHIIQEWNHRKCAAPKQLNQ